MELKKVTVKSFKELLKANFFCHAEYKPYKGLYANNIKDVKLDKFGKSERISIRCESNKIEIYFYDGYSRSIYFKGLEIYKIENLENAFLILDCFDVIYLDLGKATFTINR